jgi:glutaminase
VSNDAAGDTEIPFSIQSISKPFVYATALADHGKEAVLRKIGVEPTGDAFNAISLHPATGQPFNPMINAGAIATTALVVGETPEEQWQRMLQSFARFVGREVTLDEAVYRSESELWEKLSSPSDCRAPSSRRRCPCPRRDCC